MRSNCARATAKKLQAAEEGAAIDPARIDSGDYGWCEETGERRLASRVCSHGPRPPCRSKRGQERRELRQKLFGD